MTRFGRSVRACRVALVAAAGACALVACDRPSKEETRPAIDAGAQAAAVPLTPASSTTGTASAPAPAAAKAETGGRWPFTSKRPLAEPDFGAGAGLTCEDAMLMRNEIYARHGYKFKTKKLADHFAHEPWYRPEHDNVDAMLSDVEKRNVDTLKKYETNVCSAPSPEPSGASKKGLAQGSECNKDGDCAATLKCCAAKGMGMNAPPACLAPAECR